MKKHEIFFGENGLTSTSANYICNLAKEFYQKIDKEFESLSFVDETVKVLDSTAEEYTLANGNTIETLESITDRLKLKADLQSLIAWLREGLKAKDELSKEYSNWGYCDYCVLKGIEIPVQPLERHILTEDEYYGTLTVKERNRYYELETLCAVIGKFIHPNGSFNTAREALQKYIQKPRRVTGNGKDTVIYTYTPSVEPDNVEKIFFMLQNKHREYQAELNGIKHKCELAIQKSREEAEIELEQNYEEFQMIKQRLINEATQYKNDKLAEIRNLKIVIPNDLKDIYNEVAILGKK